MAELVLTCPGGEGASTSETGAFVIRWNGAIGARFRLVEASSEAAVPDGQVLYEGPQLASTVTGRPQGEYWYGVAELAPDAAGGEAAVTRWSEACHVRVEPYPLEIAGLFFAFGLAVSAATIALVVRGHRAHRRGLLG
jgi:hypothetical protein